MKKSAEDLHDDIRVILADTSRRESIRILGQVAGNVLRKHWGNDRDAMNNKLAEMERHLRSLLVGLLPADAEELVQLTLTEARKAAGLPSLGVN